MGRVPSPAPALLRARDDLNRAFPGRSKASDGIMGDAAHQLKPSDHNVGNAIDLTHDPASGVDGEQLAALALTDARVTYVIWNRQIWNRSRGDKAWRPYSGPPHDHHVHISIAAASRGDTCPWPWSPDFSPYV